MHKKILVLSGNDVKNILKDKEKTVIQLVKQAYLTHENGNSSLPFSSFLRFPQSEKNRIIALPSYLGGDFETAGIKWISSFPENLDKGINRASAVLVLNSMKNGVPVTIMEGSIISAARTAASAALASTYLHSYKKVSKAGIIGSGPINYEIVRYLLSSWNSLETLYVYDLSVERAEYFRKRCEAEFGLQQVILCNSLEEVYKSASVISFATTASKPYISKLNNYGEKKVVLHISLRDLSPEVMLGASNITDDIRHVCRAQTSIHLAEQMTGDTSFVQGTLGEMIAGKITLNTRDTDTIIFSPFGLGILDIAIGNFVYQTAVEQNIGAELPLFNDTSWI